MKRLIKKQLKCPCCGQRIIDTVDNGQKTELVEESKMDANFNPDYFQKCPKCKNQIAIKKVS